MAPVTNPDVIIVAHGSPSNPDPQERAVVNLAERVSSLVPDLAIRGATLAADGALEAAVAGLRSPMIYPYFMSDGWFVSSQLPKRLRAAGLSEWDMVTPLGMEVDLPKIAIAEALTTLQQAGMTAKATSLILAAHGSPSDPRPAQATYNFGKILERSSTFKSVRIGFVDEEPSLVQAMKTRGPALVMPFFAARAGHVLLDLPNALTEANFDGPVMPAIGTWPQIPALLAKSLQRIHTARAA